MIVELLRGRRGWSWGERGLTAITLAVFAFLFLPIVTAVVYSFNKGIEGRQTADITGYTTSGYTRIFNNPDVTAALGTSFRVAIVASVLATVLGTIAGVSLIRARSRIVRTSLGVLVSVLLVVPEIVVAVSLLLFFSETGTSLSLATLILGLTPFPLAVVALIVRSRALALDRATEEAAADLGATPTRCFLHVTLPQLRPALIASAILSFTFTFDNLIIAQMLSTPTVNTITVYLFATVSKGGVTQVGYAIAALMLVFTVVLMGIAGLLYRWDARRQGARSESFMPAVTA
jgi:ABC-type spermidine/putrescine transport system permease subunit II